ncbi:GNAT domain-containing protein [Hypomontagnella submonticulosa]|nr:GNAT domain-containing protein [Hypomontagnella submonticulosa]
MRSNENIAISTNRVLLVPYDAHHVPRYHEWMEDAAIREATASERLTLAEEYENQKSWREAKDKLTFIICEPLALDSQGVTSVVAGEVDAPSRMVGDINLFLTPWDNDDDEDHPQENPYVVAEVDIMIADQRHRGRGLGRAAVSTFLRFVRRHLRELLLEYEGRPASMGTLGGEKRRETVLRELVAKISVENAGSIALFRSLGFRQRGGVNFFGEILMVLKGFGEGDGGEEAAWEAAVKDDGYREVVYDRSRLGN